MNNKMISSRIILDFNKLLKIKDTWDKFIKNHSNNPIFLSGFIKQFMDFRRSKKEVPLILLISINNEIIGAAPLVIKRKFGLRFAEFLLGDGLSPDFIMDNRCQETCIAKTLEVLLDILKCHFITLALPAESPNLQVLKKKCKADGIPFYIKKGLGHYILPINCTWSEFKASRGQNFRRNFKRYTRNLNKAGSWKILSIGNENKEESSIFRKVLHIEKMSWKEKWRMRRGLKIDHDLLIIWRGAQHIARTESDFKWRLWFLELGNQPLAYCLVLQYKEMAFFMKTSYDERYKRLYPGIYVNNVAIRDLFNERQVKVIDFATDLSFHRNWTSIFLPRVRMLITKKGLLLRIIKIIHNVYMKIEIPTFLKNIVRKI